MPPGPTQDTAYRPDPANTRALLRALEELRDSLSQRVTQLSLAVDRLRGQADALERALSDGGPLPTPTATVPPAAALINPLLPVRPPRIRGRAPASASTSPTEPTFAPTDDIDTTQPDLATPALELPRIVRGDAPWTHLLSDNIPDPVRRDTAAWGLPDLPRFRDFADAADVRDRFPSLHGPPTMRERRTANPAGRNEARGAGVGASPVGGIVVSTTTHTRTHATDGRRGRPTTNVAAGDSERRRGRPPTNLSEIARVPKPIVVTVAPRSEPRPDEDKASEDAEQTQGSDEASSSTSPTNTTRTTDSADTGSTVTVTAANLTPDLAITPPDTSAPAGDGTTAPASTPSQPRLSPRTWTMPNPIVRRARLVPNGLQSITPLSLGSLSDTTSSSPPSPASPASPASTSVAEVARPTRAEVWAGVPRGSATTRALVVHNTQERLHGRSRTGSTTTNLEVPTEPRRVPTAAPSVPRPSHRVVDTNPAARPGAFTGTGALRTATAATIAAYDREIHRLQHRLDETSREWNAALDAERSRALMGQVPNEFSSVRAGAMRRHMEVSHQLWTLLVRRAVRRGDRGAVHESPEARAPTDALRFALGPQMFRWPPFPHVHRGGGVPERGNRDDLDEMEQRFIQRIERERNRPRAAPAPATETTDQWEYEYYRDFLYEGPRDDGQGQDDWAVERRELLQLIERSQALREARRESLQALYAQPGRPADTGDDRDWRDFNEDRPQFDDTVRQPRPLQDMQLPMPPIWRHIPTPAPPLLPVQPLQPIHPPAPNAGPGATRRPPYVLTPALPPAARAAPTRPPTASDMVATVRSSIRRWEDVLRTMTNDDPERPSIEARIERLRTREASAVALDPAGQRGEAPTVGTAGPQGRATTAGRATPEISEMDIPRSGAPSPSPSVAPEPATTVTVVAVTAADATQDSVPTVATEAESWHAYVNSLDFDVDVDSVLARRAARASTRAATSITRPRATEDEEVAATLQRLNATMNALAAPASHTPASAAGPPPSHEEMAAALEDLNAAMLAMDRNAPAGDTPAAAENLPPSHEEMAVVVEALNATFAEMTTSDTASATDTASAATDPPSTDVTESLAPTSVGTDAGTDISPASDVATVASDAGADADVDTAFEPPSRRGSTDTVVPGTWQTWNWDDDGGEGSTTSSESGASTSPESTLGSLAPSFASTSESPSASLPLSPSLASPPPSLASPSTSPPSWVISSLVSRSVASAAASASASTTASPAATTSASPSATTLASPTAAASGSTSTTNPPPHLRDIEAKEHGALRADRWPVPRPPSARPYVSLVDL